MDKKADYYFKTFPEIAAFEAVLFYFSRDSGCVRRLNEAIKSGRFSYLVGDRTGVQLHKNDEKAWDALNRKVKTDPLLWAEIQDIASEMLLPFIFSKAELDDKRKLTKKRVSQLIDRYGIFDVLWLVLCQRKPVDPKVIDFLKDELSDRIDEVLDRLELEELDDELSTEDLAKLSALEEQNAKLKEELAAYKREKSRLIKKLAEMERAIEKTKAEAAKSASILDRKRKEIESKAEALKAERAAIAEERSKLQAEKIEVERTKGGYSARLAELEKMRKDLERALDMKEKELAKAADDLKRARTEFQELAMAIELREIESNGPAKATDTADAKTTSRISMAQPEFLKLIRAAVEEELGRLSSGEADCGDIDDPTLAKRLSDLGEFLRLAAELSRPQPDSPAQAPPLKKEPVKTATDTHRTRGLEPDFEVDPSIYLAALEKFKSLGGLRKILVDGNNLVLRTMQGVDFSAERNRVIDLLEAFSEEEGIDVTAVFDSEKDPTMFSRGRVKVIFTGKGEPEADLRIEEELSFNGGPSVLVVSSDFAHVRPIAESADAAFMTSEDFRLVLEGSAPKGFARAR